MRLREFLIGTALMSLALTTANAGAPSAFDPEAGRDVGEDRPNAIEASISAPLPPEPSPLISEDKVLGSAYYDTLSILSSSNSCSDFFNGPGASVDAFNKLVGQVRKEYLATTIVMRMSGRTTNMLDAGTKNEYRLFDKVSINANGPFYKRRFPNSQPFVPRVGTFEPNTKEVRALIFLHELGHVVKGPRGNWLLPDDGKDESLSRLNSRKIEEVCGDQIKSLGKVEAKANLARKKQPEEKLALAVPTPGTQP